MRIVEVAYSLPAETFIQRHAEALYRAGVDLILVARSKTDPKNANASIADDIFEIPAAIMPTWAHMKIGEKLSTLRYALFHLHRSPHKLRYKALLAFFERLKPDLIHFHTARYAASLGWVPRALGIPYTVSVRGSDIQVFPLRSREMAREIARALRRATLVHAVCDHLGDLIQILFGTRLPVRTIYTTVPVPPNLPDYEPPNNRLHFLSVGRLMWRKAHVDLLSAVAWLKKEGLPAHLTLIGSGVDEQRILWWMKRFRLQGNVDFPGRVPANRLPQMYSRATAFVQSSIAEGFSNAVAEAMAWGCPVFATAVGGTAEIIRDGENGFLLPPLQPERWTEKLSLARERTVMQQVREAAYETARKYFSPQQHAEAFVSFFEEAIRRGTTPRTTSQAYGSENGYQHELANNLTSFDDVCLLIRGEWRWENGADLILRALAPLVRNQRMCLIFQGKGPQEDELRYLARFLDIDKKVIFFNSEEDFENKTKYTRKEIPVLYINNAQNQGWWLQRSERVLGRIPFGNLKLLILLCSQALNSSLQLGV